MDYQKIYNQIVEKAKNRMLEGYKEKHHIIPKCLGGNNDKDNLVELTAREHFLCHMLLCEIYPKEYKLKHALFLMAIGKQKVKEKIAQLCSICAQLCATCAQLCAIITLLVISNVLVYSLRSPLVNFYVR